MTVTLGPLVVDAVEPGAVERFWAVALGGPPQRALLSFRPQSSAKTVKNRVHLDVYVRDVEQLLDLGARVLAEYLPTRMTLALALWLSGLGGSHLEVRPRRRRTGGAEPVALDGV